MQEIKIGYIYRHFKGDKYTVLDIVNDSETNRDEEQKKVVIYQALYGNKEKWAKPLDMFASEVDHKKVSRYRAKMAI